MEYYKSSLIFTSRKKNKNTATLYSDFTSQLRTFQWISAHCRCHTKQAELLTTTTLSPSHTSQYLQTSLKLRYQPGHQQQILLQSQSPFLTSTAYYELHNTTAGIVPKSPTKPQTVLCHSNKLLMTGRAVPSSHRQARALSMLPQASEVRLFAFSVKIRSCLYADSEIH